MSLFTSFNSGVAGIRASQSGLNTTTHNIANAKTSGYTRQQNIHVDSQYQTYKIALDGSKMQIGLGTSVSYIRQIRDVFLDKEYRLEVGRQSFYERLVQTANEVEDIFGETEGVAFQDTLKNLWDVAQDLSTDPEDITYRQMFISTAEAFLESSKNVYTSLHNYQLSLNKEIQSQVDKINELGEKIAAYNVLVAKSEAAGEENANDYRDMRNLLMDELGEYTNYTYFEDVNGTVQIYVENAMFVANGLSYHLGCQKMESSNMLEVVWLDNGYEDAYDINEAYSTEKKTDVGSLRGILTARGNKLANYADIPVEPKQEDYEDEEAFKVAMNKFKADLKYYNNTTGNSIITKVQAQFDQLVHGVVTAINDVFAPNIEVSMDENIYATDEYGKQLTDVNGDPILLVGAGKNCRILDVYNCPYGADDAETIGTEIFSRSQVDRYETVILDHQIYMTDEAGNQVLDKNGDPVGLARDNGDGTFSLYVYNEEDTSDIDWMYTLRSLEINPDLVADYSLLEVKANPNQGLTGAYAYDGLLFENLLSKWDEKFAVLDPNTLAAYTFEGYYINMIGDVGTQGSVWMSMVENQADQTASIEDKRQQVAGVSTDEEMVSLLMYQHAYNAASRYISVIDAMLEHLIERLG